MHNDDKLTNKKSKITLLYLPKKKLQKKINENGNKKRP